MSVNDSKKIRNIAIIAHVDHGKTTLVDQIFKSTIGWNDNSEVQERLMDSGEVEQQRGITIMAKCTSVYWKDHKINILDTPGHADFGSEVQRVLIIADGVLVLVDAAEGIKAQTRFVLKNALELKLPVMIFVNKIDRLDKDQRENYMTKAADSVIDYIFEQTGDIEALNIKVFYGSGRSGFASMDKNKAINQEVDNIHEVLDGIINEFNPPHIIDEPGRFLTTMIAPNEHKGRLLIGRVHGNGFKIGDKCMTKKQGSDDIEEKLSIKEMVEFHGLEQRPITNVIGGDVVGIYTGCANATVGYSLISNQDQPALPSPRIDPPVLSVTISPNNLSPGKNGGKYVTFPLISKRLTNESDSNVGIRVIKSSNSLQLSCRGALQLGILLDALCKEGYEFRISPAEIETVKKDNVVCEPMEMVHINIHQDFMGVVMNSLQQRNANITDTKQEGDNINIFVKISSRNLLGYATDFSNQTKGTGMLNREIVGYEPVTGSGKLNRGVGSLISSEDGVANAYAINKRLQRGTFFVNPGDKVYKGQIIGESKTADSLHINIVQAKKLTNMRASGKDDKLSLPPALLMPLEKAVTYIMNKEYIIATPNGIFMISGTK